MKTNYLRLLSAAALLLLVPSELWAAATTRSTVKSYFNTDDVPTEAQFSTTWDSTAFVVEAETITGAWTFSGGLSFSGTSEAGLRLNNLTTAERDALGSPLAGQLIWNTTDGQVQRYNGSGWAILGGSGNLGSNLSSSTNDILSNTGIIRLGGTGGTNNEALDFDFETTPNVVGVSSPFGVTEIDFGSIALTTTGNLDVGDLSVDRMDFVEQASISNPAATKGSIYLDSDDNTFKSLVADEGLTLQTHVTDNNVIYDSIFVSAGAMIPFTTNGAAAETITLTATADDIMVDTMAFDTATEEGVGFWWTLPEGFNGTEVQMKFHWTINAGTTGQNVKWDAAALAYANDDPIDAALGTEQTVTDASIAINDMHISGWLGADLAIGGGPAAGEPVWFEITRDITVGTDQDDDAHLIGVTIEYSKKLKTTASSGLTP